MKQFNAGDRARLRRPSPEFPKGTEVEILRVFTRRYSIFDYDCAIGDYRLVLFDRELEPIEQPDDWANELVLG